MNTPQDTKGSDEVGSANNAHPTTVKYCSVSECEVRHYGKSFCKKHYKRFIKYGDPLYTQRATKGEPLRLFNEQIKIETDECILWPYSKHSVGYGDIQLNGKQYLVHRVALETRVGKAPVGKPLALHRPVVCHNRLCLNYRHLYWGSPKENMDDRFVDGTSFGPRGERNGRAKLTKIQVLSIYQDNRVKTKIAEDYGINPATVSDIKSGKRWEWLTGHLSDIKADEYFTKAEVQAICEEVIGADETGFNKYGSMCDHDQHQEIEHFNQLRAEQRNRLTDLLAIRKGEKE